LFVLLTGVLFLRPADLFVALHDRPMSLCVLGLLVAVPMSDHADQD
jgi:hypothetical protein